MQREMTGPKLPFNNRLSASVLSFVLLIGGVAFAEPVLNEVMTSNGATIADEDGEFHDWIEIFNRGEHPANLQGWGLTDDAAEPFRWVLPEVELEPGAYLLVWASGKDRGSGKPDAPDQPEPQSPASIPGLVGWFKAGGAPYSDGNAVPTWADISGRGNHAVQNEPARRPVYRANAINGKAALEFSNSERRHLNLPAANFEGMEDLRNFTFMAVARWGGTPSGLMGAWDRQINHGNVHLEIGPGSSLRLRVSALDSAMAGNAIAVNRWSVITGSMRSVGDNPVARLFVDGREVASRHEDPGKAFLNDYKQFPLGASRDESRSFDGLIAEVLLFNRALTATERHAMEQYLSREYALGTAAAHPQLHTNFKISASGENVILTRPDGTLADVAPPVVLRRDVSLGRQPNGTGDWLFFLDPTPAGSNSAIGFQSFLEPPSFSHRRGYYSAPFSLALSASVEGAHVYYTLDGSEPAPGKGILYDGGGIAIASTTIIRAAAFKESHVPSTPESHSFIFAEDVLRQPPNPAGFPTTWGGSGGQPRTAAHYKMDPRIVNDPAYSAMLREGFLHLPAMSVSMDVDDLFGEPRGIYSNPDRSGRIWERPASVEFFTPAGEEQFQINSGIRIQGGTSTANWKVMKLSMRLFFRSEYGDSKLGHAFFPDSPVQSYDTLVLGAGHNLTWQHPDHGQRVRAQYIRDVFVPDLHRATGALSPHDRFANLFLNGLFWGLFYIQNRPDATFMADNLGGSPADYDVVRHNGNNIVDGNNAAWNVMMGIARSGLGSASGYQAIQEHLDIPAFIDYMLVNFWAGNTDWPHHNWYAGRKREPGSKFLFFSWDAEHVLKSLNDNRTGVNNSNGPGELYDRLRANPEFRLLFADRAHRHFSPAGAFHVDAQNPRWDPARPERNRPAALYMKRIAEIDTAMALETARWGDTRRPAQPYTRNVEWAAELNWMLNEYLPKRSRIVLDQLRSAGLYPAVNPPSFTPHGGPLLNSDSLAMNAQPDSAVYYMLNGADPRVPGSGAVSPEATLYTGPLILTTSAIVKARALRNGEWSALSEAAFTAPPLAAHPLSEGPYQFTQWSHDSPAGSYPPSMVFEQAQQTDPELALEMNGYWRLPYNLENRSRLNGLGSMGISFINTANAQEIEGAGYLGSARLAIDTRVQDEIWIQWTAGTVTPNTRVYGLRPQYRLGFTGPFVDLLDAEGRPLEYLRNDLAGHAQTFGPMLLPPQLANQPYVEVRWKYYHVDGFSGPRAELRLDNIFIGPKPSATVSSFEGWRRAHFVNGPDLDNPDISGPLADPAGTGAPNLVRYAFGLGIDADVGQFAPELRLFDRRLAFSFPFDPLKSDIAWIVLTSTDLNDWSEVIFDSRVHLPPEPGEGWVHLPVTLEGDSENPKTSRFFRLQLVLTSDL
jgi:hypothetical protein